MKKLLYRLDIPCYLASFGFCLMPPVQGNWNYFDYFAGLFWGMAFIMTIRGGKP